MKSLLHLLQCNQNGSKSPIFSFLDCAIVQSGLDTNLGGKQGGNCVPSACVKSTDELAQCLSKDT